MLAVCWPWHIPGMDLEHFARREQFKHCFAQQVDRAHFAIEALPDNLHHTIQLALRMHARSHHLMQASENLTSGSDCGHATRLEKRRDKSKALKAGYGVSNRINDNGIAA